MNKKLKKILIVIFWIVIWGLLALAIANPIILAGPIDVGKSLYENITNTDFWLTILSCFLRIGIGFAIACVLGCTLAYLSYKFKTFNDFVRPLIQLMKSAPIVCFIVLLLVWVGVFFVDVVTVIIAVVPVYYFAIYEACQNRNKDIANMLKVYKVPSVTKWRIFEWPSALPYFNQATQTGIGLSWKSGVTAQMIGAVGLTIGEKVFEAKLYLDSAQLLLWMFIVILLGWVCEKIIIAIIKAFTKSGQKKSLSVNHTNVEVTPADDAMIVVGNITKSYKNKKVLDNVTYKIDAGDRFALTGPTGSGKTTLINIILGIEDADSGEIFVKEYEPRTFSTVFQTNTLIDNMTVKNNVEVISKNKTIGGLVDKNLIAGDLSGGMKRCAEIERAISADSQIVIMDEPFAGLDDKTKDKAIAYIDKNLRGRTFLLITHDEEDAKKLRCLIN